MRRSREGGAHRLISEPKGAGVAVVVARARVHACRLCHVGPDVSLATHTLMTCGAMLLVGCNIGECDLGRLLPAFSSART